jgi:hypothetical protein
VVVDYQRNQGFMPTHTFIDSLEIIRTNFEVLLADAHLSANQMMYVQSGLRCVLRLEELYDTLERLEAHTLLLGMMSSAEMLIRDEEQVLPPHLFENAISIRAEVLALRRLFR